MYRIVTMMGVMAAGLLASVSLANAQSAVLTQVQGNVLINAGSGFVPAANGTPVRVGYQVAVRGPGGATIDFGNGQVINVPGSSTILVRAPLAGVGTVSPSLIVGGVVVAGAIGGIVAVTNDSGSVSSTPISP